MYCLILYACNLRKKTPLSQIIEDIENNKFKILKRTRKELTVEEAERFYSDHLGKFFYPRLISFMTGGPLEVLVLKRDDAISEWRKLIGPTHAEKARTLFPQSIRARFGYSDTRNSTHGSDSEETAKREINFFFPEFDYDKSNNKE